jgi:hypothetical protein
MLGLQVSAADSVTTIDTPSAALSAALEGCAATLDTTRDVGYPRIAVRCPRAMQLLRRDPAVAWLPPGWDDPQGGLSAAALRELALRLQAERRSAAAPPGAAAAHAPDAALLEEVIGELGGDATRRASVWQRLNRWLRSMLDREPTATASQPRWLRRFERWLTRERNFWDYVGYAAYALVFGLTLWLIANELRSSGLLGQRRALPVAAPIWAPHAARAVSLADVRSAQLAARPGLLLQLLADLLQREGTVDAGHALTARQVQIAIACAHQSLSAEAATLVQNAEQLRYAETPPGDAAIAAAVASGTRVYEQLRGAAPTGPA